MELTSYKGVALTGSISLELNKANSGSRTKWLFVTLSAISGLAITVAFLDMRS